MFKRVTLLWKRPELSVGEFADAWLGEHAAYARQLPGLREYVIDIVENPGPNAPDGIATLRFDSREECEAAFATPDLKEDLLRTRNEFAISAQILHVEERVVHREKGRKP